MEKQKFFLGKAFEMMNRLAKEDPEMFKEIHKKRSAEEHLAILRGEILVRREQ